MTGWDWIVLLISVPATPLLGWVALLGFRKFHRVLKVVQSEVAQDIQEYETKRVQTPLQLERKAELEALLHRQNLAEQHARTIRVESYTLALIEQATVIKPGDVHAAMALPDNQNQRAQKGEIYQNGVPVNGVSRILAGQAKSQQSPTNPSSAYYVGLHGIYRSQKGVIHINNDTPQTDILQPETAATQTED